jgi:F0F1-type ATP synthase assembly protein I
MSDDPPDEPPQAQPTPQVDAWAVVSYLLGGVILYGGIGWLVDRWLDTRGFVAVGIVGGAAAGVVIVWLRYGRPRS